MLDRIRSGDANIATFTANCRINTVSSMKPRLPTLFTTYSTQAYMVLCCSMVAIAGVMLYYSSIILIEGFPTYDTQMRGVTPGNMLTRRAFFSNRTNWTYNQDNKQWNKPKGMPSHLINTFYRVNFTQALDPSEAKRLSHNTSLEKAPRLFFAKNIQFIVAFILPGNPTIGISPKNKGCCC